MLLCALIIQCLSLGANSQGPGNGIAKTTHASSQPLIGLEFMLRYLPTTVAEDSCYANYCTPGSFPGNFFCRGTTLTHLSADGEKWQGRAQIVQPFTGMIERNCRLYSSYGAYSSAPFTTVNIVKAQSQGVDCGYYSGYSFDTAGATLLYTAFAHNQV